MTISASRLLAVLAVSGLVATCALPAGAASWDDAGPTDAWNTTDLNWGGAAWSNGDAALFNGGDTVTVGVGITQTGMTVSGNYVFLGAGIGGAGGVTLGDGSYVQLNGRNTYTGNTLIGTNAFMDVRGTLGNGTYAGNITNNGWLAFSNNGDAVNQTLSGAISGTGGVQNDWNRTLTLSGTNTYAGQTNNSGTLNVSGSVSGASDVNNSGTLNVGGSLAGTRINNSGTLNVSGSVSGASDVNNSGTLSVSGSLAGTNITNYYGTLNVSGTVAGSVTNYGYGYFGGGYNSGTLNITGAMASDVTLYGGVLTGSGSTTGNLAFGNNSYYYYPSTIVGGAVGTSFQANTVTLNTTVNVAGTDGMATTGTRTMGVVRYATGDGPALGNFNTSNYRGASLANVGSAGGETRLTYTSAADVWNGGSGTWVAGAGGPAGWNNGGDGQYCDGDLVVFNDLGAGGTVALNTVVTPGSVAFNNSGTSYAVSGNGGIGGATGLTKSGSGTVTLSTHNAYTGDTAISGGVLAIGNGGWLGNHSYGGAIALSNGANFTYGSGETQVLSGVISGNGSVTQTAGTLILTNANTYTGTTTVNNGTLKLDFTQTGGPNANILNSAGNFSAVVLGGGTLEVDGKTGQNGTVQRLNGISTTAGTGMSVLSIVQGAAAGVDVDLGAVTLGNGSFIYFQNGTGTAAGARWITSTGAGANDGNTKLGNGSLYGDGWASIRDVAGTKYVVGLNGGMYTDVATDQNYGAPAGLGDVRIVDGSAGATAVVMAGDTTMESLLMAARNYQTTIDTGGHALTIGGGGNRTGAIATTRTGSWLTIGSSADSGTVTAGTGGDSSLILNAMGGGLVINSKIANGLNASLGVNITGYVQLNGNNTYTGNTLIGTNAFMDVRGTLGNGNYAGNIANNGGLAFGGNGDAVNQTLAGAISGRGGVQNNWNHTLTLSGANTYAGDTYNYGTLNVGGSLAGTNINSYGTLNVSGSVSGASYVDNSGTLSVSGSLAGTSISNSGTLNVGGSLVGTHINSYGTLNVSGSVSGASDVNNSGTLSVSGSLAGTNITNYYGTLNVSGTVAGSVTNYGYGYFGGGYNSGTLNITGAMASDVTLYGGVLTGSGSTAGNLAFSNNSYSYYPSTIVGSAVGTSFQANAVTLNTTVNVAGTDGMATTGTRTMGVVRYATGDGPALWNFNTSNYRDASLANVGSAGGETRLTYTSAADVWNGGSGTWVAGAGGPAGWNNGGDGQYCDGDLVVFNDLGAGGTVTLNTVVTPGSVAFNNSSTSYAVSGNGGIGGATGLTKSGSGTVTMSTYNTYTGTTAINQGVLTITHNNALGSTAGGTTVANGATLELNGYLAIGDEALTIAGAGVGGIGALHSIGDNTYGGLVTIATGTSASINNGGGHLTLTGGVSKNGSTVTFSGGGTTTISGVGISGVLAKSDLVVDNGTTLQVQASSNYNGPTSIIGGSSLWVDGSGVTVTTTKLSVGNGLNNPSSVYGTGTIDVGGGLVKISSGSRIAAGTIGGTPADIGKLTLNLNGGDFTLNGTYVFDVDYGSETGDLLSITNADFDGVTFGSSAKFQLDAGVGAAPAAGSHYEIKIFESNVAAAGVAPGQSNFTGATLGLRADQTIVTWDGGMTYYLVPEPASIALLGLGGLLLLRRPSRRRGRRAQAV